MLKSSFSETRCYLSLKDRYIAFTLQSFCYKPYYLCNPNYRWKLYIKGLDMNPNSTPNTRWLIESESCFIEGNEVLFYEKQREINILHKTTGCNKQTNGITRTKANYRLSTSHKKWSLIGSYCKEHDAAGWFSSSLPFFESSVASSCCWPLEGKTDKTFFSQRIKLLPSYTRILCSCFDFMEFIFFHQWPRKHECFTVLKAIYVHLANYSICRMQSTLHTLTLKCV